jgi:hypothetical protein
MTSRRPLSVRSGARARRTIAVTAALVVGSSTLVLTSTAASATTIADPGELIAGSIGSYSGTCADSPWAELAPSWGLFPTSFEVDAEGNWNGAYYVGEAGPATITVTCGIYDGLEFIALEDPVTVSVVIAAPMLDVIATVGTDPATCATTESIVVAPGTQVYWCYRATNRTGQTKDFHEIEDSLNGVLAVDAAYDLLADDSVDTRTLGIVSSSTVGSSVTNTVEWEAYGLDGPRYGVVSGTASAQVTVSSEPSTTTTTTTASPSTTAAVPTTTTSAPRTAAAVPVTARPHFTG